jgi:hypothetical protein
MGGNTSFLTVLKSRTGSTMGRHLIAASTRECVGESRPRRIRGRISSKGQRWVPVQGSRKLTVFEFHTGTIVGNELHILKYDHKTGILFGIAFSLARISPENLLQTRNDLFREYTASTWNSP